MEDEAISRELLPSTIGMQEYEARKSCAEITFWL